MVQQTPGHEVQSTRLTPTKDTLTALKSDVTLETAIFELCDNSLDAWQRYNGKQTPAQIEIFTECSNDSTALVIQDDTGGVKRENAAMLFGLGRTAKNATSRSIGTFGVGAKKSLVNLGLPFTIQSRHADADIGWSYRIDHAWIEDEDDWTVDVYPDDEINPGVTRITIEDLNYEWDQETIERLRTQLGQTYNIFLSDAFQQLRGVDYNLEILVEGTPVQPAGLPEWAYPPFDRLAPRRYENIEIVPPNFDEPVILHITVGLLRKKNSEVAGTDVYCQQRKVESALRGDIGGFGSGTDRIGVFNAHHERLKVIVELETDGDGQQLPWDTQKSSIDRHNPIMRGTDESRGVYNWLRRTVTPYYKADADTVPQAFVDQYPATNEFANNGGKPDSHDFSDRQRVVEAIKPATELPTVTMLRQAAEAHSTLRVKCESCVESAYRPAYTAQLKTECNKTLEDLLTVETVPSDLDSTKAQRLAGKINELARIHLTHGIHGGDLLPGWKKPLYNRYFEKFSNGDYQRVEEIPEELPGGIKAIDLGDISEQSISTGPIDLSIQQLKDGDADDRENAELFLVFGGEGEDERGSRVLDTDRAKVCDVLGLPSDVTDDIIWEEFRDHLNQFDRNQPM